MAKGHDLDRGSGGVGVVDARHVEGQRSDLVLESDHLHRLIDAILMKYAEFLSGILRIFQIQPQLNQMELIRILNPISPSAVVDVRQVVRAFCKASDDASRP